MSEPGQRSGISVPPAPPNSTEAFLSTSTNTLVSIPTATATETPPPTSTSTATPTTTPTPYPWLFSGVLDYGGEDGLLLYGNLTNNSETAQELTSIGGTFYDTNERVIASTDSVISYWPGYVIPAGGSMPFELTVDSIDSAANFNLSAEAEPSSEIPRQDFEWSDLDQWIEEDSYYCVAGTLRNRGSELSDYLVIALTLYDGQDNVVSFRAYEEFSPSWIAGDECLEFELCADLLRPTTRHEMQAWGR